MLPWQGNSQDYRHRVGKRRFHSMAVAREHLTFAKISARGGGHHRSSLSTGAKFDPLARRVCPVALGSSEPAGGAGTGPDAAFGDGNGQWVLVVEACAGSGRSWPAAPSP
jgi:hypothetical protein